MKTPKYCLHYMSKSSLPLFDIYRNCSQLLFSLRRCNLVIAHVMHCRFDLIVFSLFQTISFGLSFVKLHGEPAAGEELPKEEKAVSDILSIPSTYPFHFTHTGRFSHSHFQVSPSIGYQNNSVC